MEYINQQINESQIDEIQKAIEGLIGSLKESRESMKNLLKTTMQNISSVEELILEYADGEEQFRPILESLLNSEKKLQKLLNDLDIEIKKAESELEKTKLEDSIRREKILIDFEGTKQ